MPIRRAAVDLPPLDEADAEIVRGLEQHGSADIYLRWLEELCAPHLGSKVLEIGAGRGNLTERLGRGWVVRATELSARSTAVLEARFASHPNIEDWTFDFMTDEIPERHDTIVMINVLEHIRDDDEVVRCLFELLQPGGCLVLYVSAFWFLYSSLDRLIGHYRRYRRPELRSLVEAHGFEIVHDRDVNAVGAIGWLVRCRLLRRRASDRAIVSACDRYVAPVMRRVEARARPPFGLSLFCAARRPDEPRDAA